LTNVSDTSKLIEMYKSMLRIRVFEEAVAAKFAEGHIPGFVHLYIGQEAVAVGVMAALRSDDYIVSTHRGHGHLIAKGVDIKKLMAEIYGKSTGSNKGRGGSMHAADFSIGVVGANGIVGSGIGLATGVGLALKYKKQNRIAVAFFGDGASNTGVFHESLNLASIWKLPVLYVCENNKYAATTHVKKSLPVENVSVRASSYNMPSKTVDGTNVLEVYEAAKEFAERARRGEGPALLEAKVMRIRGHFEGDPQHYRPKDEAVEWLKANDPIKKFKAYLMAQGIIDEKLDEEIRKSIEKEIREAIIYAESSPFPRPEEALDYVYYEGGYYAGEALPIKESIPKSSKEGREITYVEAVREALDHEMARSDDIIVMGEDVVAAGVWGVTRGLAQKYGADIRVLDTPISEDGFTLAAVGAAIMGLRVVVEHRFSDFLYLAMNAILNHAAKLRYMSGGQVKIPVIIRSAMGAGLSAAAQHSSTNVAMFANHPGVKVVAPSTPFDGKGLLIASLRDGNPIIFFEHKKLYRVRGYVPEDDYIIPLGKADVKVEGNDVTIITYSYMVYEALKAAETLAKEHHISVEVVDLRTIYPLDIEAIIKSVKKTGRVVVVDEGWSPCGVASEVISTVIEKAFDYLKAPPVRINTLHAPIPFSPSLEQYILPNKDKIINAVLKVVQSL